VTDGDSHVFSPLVNPALWEDPRDILARQLSLGRLLLVLGAGVSVGFGLPQWDDLIARTAATTHCTLPAGQSSEDAAEFILHRACGSDELKFASSVRTALYQTYDSSIEQLTKNRLLAAIGALTMASARGNVTRVVSFNFDDLVEKYLAYHGFVENSIAAMPTWATIADVHVYHPHGILPSDSGVPVSSPIVFAQIQYDRRIGKGLWHHALVDAFSSHTCLFIGLSGNDHNLTNILTEVSDSHVGVRVGDPFWGVRLSENSADSKMAMWNARKIKQHTLTSYSDLPQWLFDICQRAAALVRRG
jgi:SIR2-like domain